VPLEINRPGDRAPDKPRLSTLGRRVAAVLVLVLVVVAVGAAYTVQANRRRAELRADVLAAVERSKVVCADALSSVSAGDSALATLQGYSRRIDDSADLGDKVDASYEMITYALGHVAGSQAQIDELNGARNRILYAVKQYGGLR